jgi:hypothetical protein
VFVYDTNNDDIPRFPIVKLDLHFYKNTDTLRYSTKGPEVGLSEGGKRYIFQRKFLIRNLAKYNIRLQHSVTE